MKQQYIDKITKACIKANPGIVIENTDDEKSGKFAIQAYSCRPIQLADILLALDKVGSKEGDKYLVSTDGTIYHEIMCSDCDEPLSFSFKGWNLTKSLEEQEEETLKFIAEII